jgi:hypothetical protein
MKSLFLTIVIKSRRVRWTGHVALMGEKRNACRILVGKPEAKITQGRQRHKWVGNNEMYCTVMAVLVGE